MLFSRAARLPKTWGIILGDITTAPLPEDISARAHRSLLWLFKCLIILIVLCSCSARQCVVPPELIARVEQSRGLRLKEPVPCYQAASNRELSSLLEESLDRRLTPRELKVEALQLKLLGAIPENWRYREEVLRLYVSRLSAFYSPEFKRFVLARGFSRESEEIVAHELTHALQDQHYDLSLLTANHFSNDELIVRMAIFEGDANITMRRVAGKSWCENPGPSFEDLLQQLDYLAQSKAPKFLEVQVAAPYLLGERYLCRLIKQARSSGTSRDLWKTLEAAYQSLPKSSAVLFDREDRWSRPMIEFYGEVYREDSLGAVGILALLMNVLDAKAAAKIVAKVEGDRLIVGKSERETLLWAIDVSDREVRDALRAALEKLYLARTEEGTDITATDEGVLVKRTGVRGRVGS